MDREQTRVDKKFQNKTNKMLDMSVIISLIVLSGHFEDIGFGQMFKVSAIDL